MSMSKGWLSVSLYFVVLIFFLFCGCLLDCGFGLLRFLSFLFIWLKYYLVDVICLLLGIKGCLLFLSCLVLLLRCFLSLFEWLSPHLFRIRQNYLFFLLVDYNFLVSIAVDDLVIQRNALLTDLVHVRRRVVLYIYIDVILHRAVLEPPSVEAIIIER